MITCGFKRITVFSGCLRKANQTRDHFKTNIYVIRDFLIRYQVHNKSRRIHQSELLSSALLSLHELESIG